MKSSFSWQLTPLIAHRGFSLMETENTAPAIQKTFLAGIRWVEVDIQMTLDRQLVVFHDFNLERLAGLKDNVRNKTLEELQNIPILDIKTKQRTSKILSFKELMKLAQELYLSLNLEIKIEKENFKNLELISQLLLKELQKYKKIPIICSSFVFSFLEVFSSFTKSYRLGWILDQIPSNWQEKLHQLQAYSLHCSKNIVTQELVNQAKSLGYSFLVYTVDDKTQAQKFLTMGADGIISNDALLLREY